MARTSHNAPTASEIKAKLEKEGIEISLENAQEVLQILSFLAKLIVKQNLLK